MPRPERPPTPEEMAKITKAQKETQKQMISEGAQWKTDKEGDPFLNPTGEQMDEAKYEMNLSKVNEKIENLPIDEKRFTESHCHAIDAARRTMDLIDKIEDERVKKELRSILNLSVAAREGFRAFAKMKYSPDGKSEYNEVATIKVVNLTKLASNKCSLDEDKRIEKK